MAWVAQPDASDYSQAFAQPLAGAQDLHTLARLAAVGDKKLHTQEISGHDLRQHVLQMQSAQPGAWRCAEGFFVVHVEEQRNGSNQPVEATICRSIQTQICSPYVPLGIEETYERSLIPIDRIRLSANQTIAFEQQTLLTGVNA